MVSFERENNNYKTAKLKHKTLLTVSGNAKALFYSIESKLVAKVILCDTIDFYFSSIHLAF